MHLPSILKRSGLITACSLYLIVLNNSGYSQCCSPGTPVSGSGNIGIVEKSRLRVIAYYRLSHSDTYYDGKKKADQIYQGSTADYHFAGLILGYGLLKRLTLEAEAGYFPEKRQENPYMGINRTYGLSGALLSIKYLLLKSPDEWEITLGTGIKIPMNRRQFSNEFGPLPPDLQPSTGAGGFAGQLFLAKTIPARGMKFILVNRFETNAENRHEYRFGNALITSAFVSKSLHPRWNALLHARYEQRSRDTEAGIRIENTGGRLIYLSPQLSYRFPAAWSMTFLYEVPVYRNFNKLQLSMDHALGLGITRTF